MVAALGLLGGCGGGESEKMADFPKVEKVLVPVQPKGAADKGLGRAAGSERGTPNP